MCMPTCLVSKSAKVPPRKGSISLEVSRVTDRPVLETDLSKRESVTVTSSSWTKSFCENTKTHVNKHRACVENTLTMNWNLQIKHRYLSRVVALQKTKAGLLAHVHFNLPNDCQWFAEKWLYTFTVAGTAKVLHFLPFSFTIHECDL